MKYLKKQVAIFSVLIKPYPLSVDQIFQFIESNQLLLIGIFISVTDNLAPTIII